MALEYFYSTTSLGNLCQCSVTLTVKKCCLMFRENLPCFCLCPLCLVLSLGTTDKHLSQKTVSSLASNCSVEIKNQFSRDYQSSSLLLINLTLLKFETWFTAIGNLDSFNNASRKVRTVKGDENS